MPKYTWLLADQLDFAGIQRKVDVMAMLGVPYGDAIHHAPEMARAQAAKIAADWGIKVYPIAIGTGASYQTIRDPFFGDRRIRVARPAVAADCPSSAADSARR